MACSDGFSCFSQQESLDGENCTEMRKEKMDKAVWKLSETADYEMLLAIIQLFRHKYALLGYTSLYTLYDDKLPA